MSFLSGLVLGILLGAACNDDREDWTECDFHVTNCPRIIKNIF